MNPLISIIIVNWNGKKWLDKCLSSLRSQTYRNFEIIFVDNASTDDSIGYVKSNFPEVKIVVSDENLGFAGGNNLGIEKSRSKYILLLNNDTWMEDSFLQKYISEFEKSDFDILGVTEARYGGTLNPKPSLPKIDLLGHPIYIPLITEQLVTQNLFYISGVCALFKKEFYDQSGGLDNDFFMYVEEVDWIWRARLYGGKIGQITNLYIYHAGAGSTGGGIKYSVFLWRNQNTLQMLLKNYSLGNLIWIIPIYICINIFEILIFTFFGRFQIAYSYIEGWIFNIKNLKKIFEKRRIIQQKRIISDKEIMKDMYWGIGKIHHLIAYLKKNEKNRIL